MIKQNITPILLFMCFFLSALVSNAQNHALQFDGTNDKITIPHNEVFNIGEGFTIEAWINASVWRPEVWRGSIVTKDSQGPDSGFAFRCGNNGTLNFVMSVNQGWNEISSGPVMNTGQWYHVAVVVEGDKMRLLINGEVVSSKTFTGTPTPNTQSITIGESSGFPGRYFNGVIDEVRVWNVARTNQEIFDNQGSSFDGTESGLIAYFPMNEGEGTDISNKANGDLNGTASGFATDAWVDGFTIPATDVAIGQITAPDVISITKRPIRFQFPVQNNGTEAVSNIPVTILVNGNEVASETIDQTLEAGETLEYTSQTLVDLSQNATNNVVIRVEALEDGNDFNNETTLLYKKQENSQMIPLVERKQHNFGAAGQTQFSQVILPNDLDEYDQLLLHIGVQCPIAGCDPWDQPGKIMVIQGDQEYEIARFITPFGIACGDWTVDVTDFKSVLTGPVSIRSFIQVWGPSGWLLNADLELIKNEDQPTVFQQVTPLWSLDNWVYGDPDISYDLPERTLDVAANTTASHLRMTISGHGQGNTDNAAEFSERTHQVLAGGMSIDNHHLWKTDCAQNACSNQLGTWLFSRAGWCPGQEVKPYTVDLTDHFQAESSQTIDYDLEEYTNLLNTGYDGAGHTEPHYRIWAYFIEQSAERFNAYNNLSCEAVSVAIADEMYGAVSVVLKNTGSEAITNPTVTYWVNEIQIAEETINETIEAGAELTYQFTQEGGFTAGEVNRLMALVSHPNDENLNDDAQRTIYDSDFTVGTEAIDPSLFQVFPNPTPGQVRVSFDDDLRFNQMEVVDFTGRVITTIPILSEEIQLNLNTSGIYLLRVYTADNKVVTKKLVVFSKP